MSTEYKNKKVDTWSKVVDTHNEVLMRQLERLWD